MRHIYTGVWQKIDTLLIIFIIVNDSWWKLLVWPALFLFVTIHTVSEGSGSETDEENERQDVAEEETDDEENIFFDTRDFLSSSSFKSSGSDFHKSEIDSDNDEFCGNGSVDGFDDCMKAVGSQYPYVRRRKKLPDPVEKEKGVSLWSMIKDNIGKDLTKVCLPVYFNEPLSSLQKCFEDLEYSYLIDRACEWGKKVTF